MSGKLFLSIVFMFGLNSTHAQQRVDSLAAYVLDRAVERIQNLVSCTYTAHITYDVSTADLGLVKHSYTDKVSMRFPDKMLITSTGDKGRRLMAYNGKKFYLYSYVNHNYVEVTAPETILGTIHAINNNYGIEFPAADFFYPTFTDDIIATGGSLIYLGTTWVGDKECHHIAGMDTKGTGFQFWITDIQFLPVKMVMVYGSEKGGPQYEAIYTDWVLNPVLSDSMFEFIPPPSASKTKLTPVAQTK